MFFAWTKQFFIATGLFALVLTGQTLNIAAKEKHTAEKALKEAQRTVRVTTTSQIQFN